MNGTRAFVAIELSSQVRERLREVRRTLVDLSPAWEHEKWVAEDNLHLTLKFLGNQDDARLDELRVGLSEGISDVVPFQLGLAGVRAVPGTRRCSMVWARFDDPDGWCTELARRVETAACAIGVEADKRPFAPHVTLVRARHPRRLVSDAVTSANAAAITPAISMSVLSATLFASTLTQTGPVYDSIGSWTLQGPG